MILWSDHYKVNEHRMESVRQLQISPASSDGDSQLVVVLGFFALAILCYLAKPCPVPEAAVRRRRRLFVRRNRGRGSVNIDPSIRKEQISRSLVTQTIVAIEDDGKIKLAPIEGGNDIILHDGESTQSKSKSPTGRNRTCCSICLEVYAIGDHLAWDRHDHTCLHVFHEECISEWLMTHNDCPSCRLTLIKSDEEDEESASVTSTSSSVFEVVDGLISKANAIVPLETEAPRR